MSEPARVRTVVATTSAERRAVILGLLEESAEFEVVGLGATERECLEQARTAGPELIIIDHEPPALDGEIIAEQVSGPRGSAVLLIVERLQTLSPDERKRLRTRQISHLRRDLMLRDATREHVKTRLGLLSARCSARRRTATARSLKQEIAQVRATVRKPLDEWMRRLASAPREVILLAGGRGSIQVVERVLQQVETLNVPVVLALDDGHHTATELADRLQALAQVRVGVLRGARPMSRMSDVLVVSERGALHVDGGVMAVELSEQSSHLTALHSMSTIGSAGLSVLLSSEDEDSPRAMAELASLDAGVAVVDPDICPEPAGPAGALRWQVCEHPLDAGQLAWLLQNCPHINT